jgi:hypothetical protein
MAGQGIQRREMLRILGTAAVAAQFPGFSKWGFACGHIGNAILQIKPAAYQPQFFTAGEYAMVERLADVIIPSDATPGAKEAGVAEFIDFMVANDPEHQYPFRLGRIGSTHTANRVWAANLSSFHQSSSICCSNLSVSKTKHVRAKKMAESSSH